MKERKQASIILMHVSEKLASKRKGASSREHKSWADAHMKERMAKDKVHSCRPKISQRLIPNHATSIPKLTTKKYNPRVQKFNLKKKDPSKPRCQGSQEVEQS